MPRNREMLILLSFLLIFAILYLLISPQYTPEQNVRIGIQQGRYLNSYFPVYVADKAGFFKGEGLNVTIFELGTTGSTNALIANKIEFSAIVEPAILAKIGGADLKVTLLFSKNENFLYSNLTSIKDLKGKRVAISCIGCGSYLNLNRLLKNEGLSIDDVQVILMPDVDQRIKAFKSGAVEATAVTELAFKPGETKIRIYLAENSTTSFTGSVVTTGKLIQENPDLVMKFTRAIAKSVNYIYNNKNETIELIKSGLQVDDEKATDVYDFIVSYKIYVSNLDMKNLNDEIKEVAESADKTSLPAEQFADQSFVNQLQKSLIV